MPEIIDLSGTPCEEEYAQIGRTSNGTECSRHEALAYRAALIAVLGPPPAGYSLRVHANPHDFGTYYTVQLVCPDQSTTEGAEYEDIAETGLRYWHQALMPATYAYQGRNFTPICPRSPSDEAIRRAIIATRTKADGTFPVEDFGPIHKRLTEAFPAIAAAAEPTIMMIHAQEGRTIH